jgi:hypothetical protein
MRMLLFATSVLVLMFTLVAGPAGAASITQIQWDVTGGTFGGPNSSGAISGGTLTFIPAGGVITTPVTSVNHAGHTFQLNLTGPSGSFQMYFPATAHSYGRDHLYDLSLSAFSAFAHPAPYITASAWVVSGGASVSVPGAYFYVAVAGGLGSGSVFPAIYNYISSGSYSTFYASHIFTLGNEVRTDVPEPTTGLLLYAGIFGVIAAGGTTARRNLKARADHSR